MPLFSLFFSWAGLASGWGVRRFHNNMYPSMFSNPTDFGKSQTPYFLRRHFRCVCPPSLGKPVSEIRLRGCVCYLEEACYGNGCTFDPKPFITGGAPDTPGTRYLRTAIEKRIPGIRYILTLTKCNRHTGILTTSN